MLKVYYLKISDFADFPDELLETFVSEDTKRLVATYRNGKNRRTKLLGEFMVRELLLSEWGLKNGDYRFGKGEHGKPYLVSGSGAFFFNLSHSGEYVVCVLADGEVGVDIEQAGRLRMEVARRFFHPGEVQLLEALPEERRKDAFFSYWSVKESFLKYTGFGLSASLSGFEVCFQEQGIQIKQDNCVVTVNIRICPIDPGYKCFVCSASSEIPEIIPFRYNRS